MATDSLDNPFAAYGGIVYGERFIGRGDYLRQIQQRVLGQEFGNLAIVGLPRIGKSSLAWKGVMEHREPLIQERTIPVFVNVGSCSQANEFYLKLVELSYEELELSFSDSRVFNWAKTCVEMLRTNYSTEIVQKYFRYLRKDKIKSIFVLDEFDHVRSFFSVADFQLLRELSYSPNTKICLVATVRKSIADIEAVDGAISNLHGTFSTIRLTVFSKEDVKLYWEHHQDVFPTDEKYRTFIGYLSGGHPWLMDKLNSQMCLMGEEPAEESSALGECLKLEMMEALDSFIHTIEEEKLLNGAIQLVLGPLYNVSSKEEEALLRYGFIRKVSPDDKKKVFSGRDVGPIWGDYAYVCFSDYSTIDLYNRYYANIPYWAEWSETEQMLRGMIITVMTASFGEDWFSGMKEKLTEHKPWPTFNIVAWEKNVEDLRKAKRDQISKELGKEDRHDVHFTLTRQLFDIFIYPLDKWFNTYVFKGNWYDWRKKFNFLSDVRNPVAHNNSEDIEEQIRVASTYCKEIKQVIMEWQQVSKGDGCNIVE